ncbi:amidoligase family protein [Roseicitreum antarcticum]|uniref:Putative amidoligase enzyme n=1 Tax=Roseicitreum antarcticum TaxID=564137 RepID=A0A1H2QQA7_9RHOB|nr:amidoligase family protein [Roseicitreum antarcticum]SDW08639.1 Putative amidoligase enzyme [Roseicitreum antarcticum]
MGDLDSMQKRIPTGSFWPLPRAHTADGSPRGTGVEIEFANLTENATAQIVQSLWGGRIVAANDHDITVEGGRLGDVRIELDLFLRDKAGSVLADKLLDLSRTVVPVEIVTAPLSPADMPECDALADALAHAGAKGSQDGVLFGFGVHLNPEVSAETADAIVPTVRAYGLVEDWLRAIDPPDPSRRLLPFVDPWPHKLVDALAADAADWTLDDLTRNYLDLSPTRNRGLDLLPLLTHLRADLVARALPQGTKGGRPTFHYRLPEARLGDPQWSVAYEWNRWVLVERIAADPALLAALAQSWTDWRAGLPGLRGTWADVVAGHLDRAGIWA